MNVTTVYHAGLFQQMYQKHLKNLKDKRKDLKMKKRYAPILKSLWKKRKRTIIEAVE